MDPLPAFKYYADPVGTEAFVQSDATCRACGRARGWLFDGAVYSVEPELEICPWCIADGTAADKFGATFSDTSPWVPEGMSKAIVQTIEQRTPGFVSWQGAHWLFHCHDAATFIDRIGGETLAKYPEALAMIHRECEVNGWNSEQIEAYLEAMDPDGEVTGYLFRCRHCGTHLAYSDSD